MRALGKPRGALIVLEGIDGAGKSSVAARLATLWRARGIRVLRRREPNSPSLTAAAVGLATAPVRIAVNTVRAISVSEVRKSRPRSTFSWS